ncbi:hypothetical protein [Flavobacterium sp. LHD-85]|uniref:hypothetical protein n=1 Tax=Flavobacterium sp. LHD-85 TaxID=3071410 RepID=UPI0027E0F627|nr:hypothetical protein [Flavobacterium sp. LHD-85]MDQ6531080.1 hypothetical protein [Flavobacterium sp. LHD-85]
MAYNNLEDSEDIQVLEIRNYLLKPNLADTFSQYFHSKFVESMKELGGYTLGEFKIDSLNDRFVWLRGFKDMDTRVKFLNDFYCESIAWKENGKAANEMMINSDNVYLLKPLNNNNLKTNKSFTVIDFYICNSTIEQVIKLFDAEYKPFLKTINITDISFWISEMKENDFPRLPVFQDKNLLVSITHFEDKDDYEAKQKAIDGMSSSLNFSIQQLVTIHHKLLLLNQQTNNQRTKNDAN